MKERETKINADSRFIQWGKAGNGKMVGKMVMLNIKINKAQKEKPRSKEMHHRKCVSTPQSASFHACLPTFAPCFPLTAHNYLTPSWYSSPTFTTQTTPPSIFPGKISFPYPVHPLADLHPTHSVKSPHNRGEKIDNQRAIWQCRTKYRLHNKTHKRHPLNTHMNA